MYKKSHLMYEADILPVWDEAVPICHTGVETFLMHQQCGYLMSYFIQVVPKSPAESLITHKRARTTVIHVDTKFVLIAYLLVS